MRLLFLSHHSYEYTHTRTHTRGYVSKKTHRGGHNYCATGEKKKNKEYCKSNKKVSFGFSDFSIVVASPTEQKSRNSLTKSNKCVRLKFVGIVVGDIKISCVFIRAAQMYKHWPIAWFDCKQNKKHQHQSSECFCFSFPVYSNKKYVYELILIWIDK